MYCVEPMCILPMSRCPTDYKTIALSNLHYPHFISVSIVLLPTFTYFIKVYCTIAHIYIFYQCLLYYCPHLQHIISKSIVLASWDGTAHLHINNIRSKGNLPSLSEMPGFAIKYAQ